MATKKQNPKGKADETDIFVGQRLRILRDAAGLSQEELAASAGVTFQQLQKYEAGTNRVAAGRLYQLATALGVAPGAFFPGDGESKAMIDLVQRQAAIIAALKELLSTTSKTLAEAAR